MFLRPMPISYLQLGTFSACGLVFFVFLLRAISQRTAEAGAKRDRRSQLGIIIQSIGIGLAGFGPVKATLAPLSGSGLAGAATVILLMGGAIGLFAASSRELGRNWSLVARTRSDHQLVRTGPIRSGSPSDLSRNVAVLARSGSGAWPLGPAAGRAAVFFAGTAIRTRIEDGLLEQSFGDYIPRVPEFYPGPYSRESFKPRRRRLPCLWQHRRGPVPCGPRPRPCRREPRRPRPSRAGRTSCRAKCPRGSISGRAHRSSVRSL